MSLLYLIEKLSSDEITKILKAETAKILRYTFTAKETDAIPKSILVEAAANKDGPDFIYKKKRRDQLIDSISESEISNLGFGNYDEAITYYDRNVAQFFEDFSIEEEFRKIEVVDDRQNIEYALPVFGECNGKNAFPHPYQLRMKDDINDHIFQMQTQRILATMPTGAGKTVLAMEVLIDIFRNNRIGNKKPIQVGWFVDSKELCEQGLQSFQKLWKQKGDRKVMAQRYFDKFNQLDARKVDKITFGAFTLLAERIKEDDVQQFLSDLDIIIIDEAHGANAYTYEKVLSDFIELNPIGKILGLTATPYRNDDNDFKSLRDMFNQYLEITDDQGHALNSPMQYLIDNKYLADIQYQVLNAERGSNNSEYYGNLHKSIITECENLLDKRENCIIFAESKSHAVALSIFLTQNSIENELIVGETSPSRRKEYLSRFGDPNKPLSFLVNHQILSTGIDVPGMNSIMILSNIESPTLALQIIGRAMRGKLNGGNETNTIFLTRDNYNKLGEFKILETTVLRK